ncbi:hypothetical protein J5751_02465 [bacterium]|nr:hypothetical protein [bacterium]
MNVTNNHDNQITANHIAACVSIFFHVLTFQSSQAAVSIWNHPRMHSINAIKESIHSTRFTAVLTVSINLLSHDVLLPLFVQTT